MSPVTYVVQVVLITPSFLNVISFKKAPGMRTGGEIYIPKAGKGKGPPISRVQFKGQLAVMAC